MNVKLLYCHDISFSFSFSFVPFLVTMKSKVFFFPIYVPVRVMSIQSTTIKNVLVLLVRFFDNTHTLYLQGQEDSSNDTTRERILQPSTGYSLGTSSRILNHSFPVDQNFSHNEEVVPRSIALPEIPPVDKSQLHPNDPAVPRDPCQQNEKPAGMVTYVLPVLLWDSLYQGPSSLHYHFLTSPTTTTRD